MLLYVSEQLSRYKVTNVSFCRQAEVVAPGSKTIVVTVLFWKELLQDVMIAVLDAFGQSFVGVLSKLGRSRVTAATYKPSRTPRRTKASMRRLSVVVAYPHQAEET